MTASSSTESQQQGENAKASTHNPDMAAYSSGFRTVFEEQACRVAETPSVGKIPHDLKGTYYRCGPSMFSAGSVVPPKTSIIQPKSPPVPDGQDMERMVLHPFEADGGLMAVTINQSSQEVISRFRYIRTAGFTNERRKGQRLYKAMDSSRDVDATANDLLWPAYRHHLEPGLNKKRKNTSNTRVIYWAKKLLTLWEGGLPYKMDELALSTEGRSQLGGILKEKQPFGGAATLDSKSERMIFFSNKQDAGGSEVTIYEFNDKFRLQAKWEEKLPGFALLSDVAVTDKYCIVIQPPVAVNGMQYMFNKEPGKVVKLESGVSVRFDVIASGVQNKYFS
jgi:all-trans-8'-apo-beta-carotenal 15,15'-oxygenase